MKLQEKLKLNYKIKKKKIGEVENCSSFEIHAWEALDQYPVSLTISKDDNFLEVHLGFS